METSKIKQVVLSLHRDTDCLWQVHLLAQVRKRLMLVAKTVEQDQHVRRRIVFWGCVHLFSERASIAKSTSEGERELGFSRDVDA